MQQETNQTKDSSQSDEVESTGTTDNITPAAIGESESTPSMKDFEEELSRSFHKFSEGDIVTGLVIGLSDTEVTIDLGSYAEAIMNLEECSNDPHFSLKSDIHVGDSITATIIKETSDGILLLSKRKAESVLAWEQLTKLQKEKTVQTVKIASAVNGGLVAYLKGIRAFIPASQITLAYVEDLDAYIGKELDVVVIEVNQAAHKVILSGKEVAKDKSLLDKQSRISKLQPGIIVKGKIETLKPYGVFVDIGEGLSGLVHISEICGKHIKSPKEVVHEGEEVNVKILSVKDGKISLSIKASQEAEEVLSDALDAPSEYSSGEEATTSLGALLKNIKF